MNSEQVSILKVFNSHNAGLTTKDVALLMNTAYRKITHPIVYLYENEYLRIAGGYTTPNGGIAVDTLLAITYKGELAIGEYKRAHNLHFWTELRAWATLVIALAALIVSIIALVLQ